MTTETMPAEAGIVERAVSFTKGCYIGQETVARLHYKGRPNRHLRGLRSARRRRGRRLRLGEKEVGAVGTACVSPAFGPIGLAIVRREAEPGDGARGRRRDGSRARWSSCHSPAAASRRQALSSRRQGSGASPSAAESPLFGGAADPEAAWPSAAATAGAGVDRAPRGYEPHPDDVRQPREPARSKPALPDLRPLLAAADEGRSVDDWGRSERVVSLMDRRSTSTTATGSGSRPRGSRTSPPRAARCWSPTTRGRCPPTRRW